MPKYVVRRVALAALTAVGLAVSVVGGADAAVHTQQAGTKWFSVQSSVDAAAR